MDLIQEIKKRQEKRHSDYAQLIASLVSGHMK